MNSILPNTSPANANTETRALTKEIPMSDSSPQDQKTVRPVALVIGLALMALLLIVVVLRQQPPAPKGVDAPSDQFSAGRVQVLLKEILSEGGPHPTGSEQNGAVRQRIVSAFESLGYEVEVQKKLVCRGDWAWGTFTICAEVQNIITRLPGREAGPALMLTAHYDSVPPSPGVADDGMAVAVVLETARILKEEGPHRNPIVFLITDSEEQGCCLGAQGFVDEHPWAREVAVVLNQEARGTSGQSYMFETSAENAWLVNAYVSAVPRPASSSLHYEIYRMLPNDSDLSVFRAEGMAGMNFAFIDGYARYHTPLDNFENLDLGSVQHQGDSVLAVARRLANIDLSNPPPGNAAWADVLGLAVVRWPASWTIPLAILTLLLHLGVAVRLIRRHALTVKGLLLGLLASFLCLLAAILLGLGLVWIVSLVAGAPFPVYAYPLPMRLAVWAAALLAGGLIATAFVRRSDAWGLAMGAWLLWALLALVLSIVLPGAAITLLLPAIVAGVLFAGVVFSRLSESMLAREAAFVSAALGACVIWLPFALVFEVAVGFAMSPAITLGLGLIAGTLAPLFAHPQGQTRVRRGLLGASTATVILAAGIAMFVPAHSATAPEFVNFLHFEDRDQGTAYWTAASMPGPLPKVLSGHFDADPVSFYPYDTLPAASAQPTTAPAPDLQVISEESVSGERVVTVQLRSPRGADWVNILVPVDALASIVVGDYTVPIGTKSDWKDYYAFTCHGPVCDGLIIQLHLKQEAPVEVLVTDYTRGLPPGGEALIQDRPPTAVPAHIGDLTIIMTRVEL